MTQVSDIKNKKDAIITLKDGVGKAVLSMKGLVNESFLGRVLIYFVISVFILLTFTRLGIANLDESYIMGLGNFSIFDILMNQISNTFIVLSLTSVLSTNIGNVYWVDIKDYRLIKPFFTCFVALAIYLISALIYSVIAYGLACVHALFVSYVFSIICLIVLSYKMISVYFGRNALMKKLKWEYRKAVIDSKSASVDVYKYELLKLKSELEKEGLKRDNKKFKYIKEGLEECRERTELEGEWNLGINKGIYETRSEKYYKYSSELCEKTLQALDQNDLIICYENIKMLMDASDWVTIFDLMDEVCLKAPLYASDILFDIKHEAGMDLELVKTVQWYSKGLLHKLVNENTSMQTIQNLLMTLADYNTNCNKKSVYENIIMTLNRITNTYYKKYSELKKVMGNKYLDEENINVCEVWTEMEKLREDTKNQINSVLELLSDDNIDFYYKPVDELYNSFITKNLSQFNHYMDLIAWTRDELIFSIKNASSFIDVPFKMRYFNVEQESLIDAIIEENERCHILAQKTINRLKELKTITINSRYNKIFDIFNESGTPSI